MKQRAETLAAFSKPFDGGPHFKLAVQACQDLDCLNSRQRRSSRARNWVSVQTYLESEITKQSLYNKKSAAALGRLAWTLQTQWQYMETSESSMIERQNIRLMLLLFIAAMLDTPETRI